MRRIKNMTLEILLETIINENYYIYIEGLTDYPLNRVAFYNEIEMLDCYQAYARQEIKKMTLGTKNECPLISIILHYDEDFSYQLDLIEKEEHMSFSEMLGEEE